MSISNSNLRFMKSYFKKSYPKEQELIGDEFDVIKKQTNKKTFNKVNKEKNKNYKYSFKKHLDVMYDGMVTKNGIVSEQSKKRMNELLDKVDEVNAFAEC